MKFFRKVFLPAAWVAIFSVIAVSLAVLAFNGGDTDQSGMGVHPTGKLPVSESVVERATIENNLTVRGTIVVDAPIAVKASHDGVVNHFFVPAGAKVEAGDNVFQIRYEDSGGDADTGTSRDSGDKDDPPKPVLRYVNVTAPTDGTIASYAQAVDDDVTKADVVTSVHRSTFRAAGTIAPLEQYRLLDKPKFGTVTIAGGPRPFECDDLTVGALEPSETVREVPQTGPESGDVDGEPGGEDGANDGAGVSISCEVPENVRVFNGLTMSMEIDAGRAENVLVVPVTAVRGLVESGSVWVLDSDGGEPVERSVRLGLSDGTVVEVKKGLKEGEQITEFVPGGDPTADGTDDGSVEGEMHE